MSINNGSVKFWSSGAVELDSYTAFKDKELVTKAYVDGAIGDIDIPMLTLSDYLPLTGGQMTDRSPAIVVQVITPFGLSKAAPYKLTIWNDGVVESTRTGFSDNHLVTKKYVDDNAGGYSGDKLAKLNSTAGVQVGGFYISNGNVYCKCELMAKEIRRGFPYPLSGSNYSAEMYKVHPPWETSGASDHPTVAQFTKPSTSSATTRIKGIADGYEYNMNTASTHNGWTGSNGDKMWAWNPSAKPTLSGTTNPYAVIFGHKGQQALIALCSLGSGGGGLLNGAQRHALLRQIRPLLEGLHAALPEEQRQFQLRRRYVVQRQPDGGLQRTMPTKPRSRPTHHVVMGARAGFMWLWTATIQHTTQSLTTNTFSKASTCCGRPTTATHSFRASLNCGTSRSIFNSLAESQTMAPHLSSKRCGVLMIRGAPTASS